MAEMTAEAGTDPAVMAAGASVLLSWYYFFVRGERNMGLFVGLWPPTILAFASYFNQVRMQDRIEALISPGSALTDSIEQFIKGR